MSRGRKPTIGAVVMSKVQFYSSVAEIVRETGAKPNTVRAVLRRAADKGSIHIERFYRGRSARTIRVIYHDEPVVTDINALVCMWCGKVKEEV
jgi:transcription initiation factor IIE alpha subunit